MSRRRLGIILSCVLGGGFFIYVCALLGQLLYHYDAWLSADGLSGTTHIASVQFSPFICLPYLFTYHGGKAFLILGAIVAGVALYIWGHNRFGNGDYDDRNFKRSKQGTYGTSGWMEKGELTNVLELSSPEKATGTILGMVGDSVVCLPRKTHLNGHIMALGASGTGKSRCFVRNQALTSILNPNTATSLILTDPKSELYSDLADICRANGYLVRVLNLVDPSHSDGWNCMADLMGDTLMVQMLTDVIISNTSGTDTNRFWDAGEANLLKALILYVERHPVYGANERHLPNVYALLTQNSEQEIERMFERLPITHPAKAPYNLFRQASDTVRTGIILGLGIRLQLLQNEAVCSILRHSDIDLTLPAQRKCAYFIILSDQDGSMDYLSSIFFSFLFIRLVRFADSQPDGRCPVAVQLILDEFNNLGTLCGADGTEFARKLSTIRSRNLQVSMLAQNLAQLQNRYPNSVWAEIIGNADVQLMLGCTDEVTAAYASDRSGDMTVEVSSTMTVRQTMALVQLIPQYRYSESLGRRKVVNPDEVLRMPNDELLIMIRGQKILKAKKFDFSRLPASRLLKKSSIMDYFPTTQPPVPSPAPPPKPENTPKPKKKPELFAKLTKDEI